VLLGLYSYFIVVELRPMKPSVTEVLVWVWAATMWLDELRQVRIQLMILTLCYSNNTPAKCIWQMYGRVYSLLLLLSFRQRLKPRSSTTPTSV